ncbi:nucleoside triphosphate pyrophosphohydrolase [Pseudalkalibacillus hwajinpoensis]|uniref:nucleoside triphosphate pyrophosphohydrolase n=1 Tax=Guptibacillus hwajinpoensis TaxID=208199 RepID=UPI00325AED84
MPASYPKSQNIQYFSDINQNRLFTRNAANYINRLGRDHIPEIIRGNGNKFNIRILDKAEYKEELQLKLKEELQEYLEARDDSHAVEELADMLELIYSLVEVHHSSVEELEEERKEKREIRGGFDDRVYLIDVED